MSSCNHSTEQEDKEDATKDTQFKRRLEHYVSTVQAWDADPSLLEECKRQIPWEEIHQPKANDKPTNYDHETKYLTQEGSVLVLQRLCRFFKQSMTWINAPPCTTCGSPECTYKTTRGPETEEERAGGATRVEVFHCPNCNHNDTTFPRYNNVRKLLETKSGRCGEYANLFGLICRASGFETRFVYDVTDHVWTEVYIVEYNRWVMADGCEGVIDEPEMYEHGWGKKGLCYMIAIAMDHIVDVTPRYTRQWRISLQESKEKDETNDDDPNEEDIHARRRKHTSSEEASQLILQEIGEKLIESLETKPSEDRMQEIERRRQMEEYELQMCKERPDWTSNNELYSQGRISGSLEWKQQRQEDGAQ